MRIVAGRHKGRPLVAPSGRDTRPTADRARETLFNIIAHGCGVGLDGIAVLDGFAGSGALGLEALSRGAAQVVFLERHPGAVQVIRDNLRGLGEQARGEVLRADATRPPPAAHPCDLVLLDPPYGQDLAGPALSALAAAGWLADDALCVVEVAASEAFSPPEGFSLLRERVSGAARFVFLSADA